MEYNNFKLSHIVFLNLSKLKRTENEYIIDKIRLYMINRKRDYFTFKEKILLKDIGLIKGDNDFKFTLEKSTIINILDCL